LDLPKSLEAYYQETGRAGRDGLPAEAWMVYGLQDVVRLRQMADESIASEEYKRHERARLDALLGWCEVTGCRRRPLLEYFGEELIDDCGNCDNCLNPPAVRDGTVQAQMLMSAVYRTGQCFGAAHVVDVLTGKSTAKTQQNGHDGLSVFGVGADTPAAEWRSIVRQLVVQGYLRADPAKYGGLVLTDAARGVLKGTEAVALRSDPLVPKAAKARKRKATVPDEVAITDMHLWEALRVCRQDLAKQHDVPPYVIFHDSTLRQMVHEKPADEAALLSISGVGQAKLERYGDEFLEVIRREGREA
ncbi:MAG: HRDC domain-containing protein, partial [Chromatiales bacterium]